MKTIITTNGLNIIGQNSGETATKYWIGYFGLAYVPDELRAEGELDELEADMTKLTRRGDNIYNLFQGSMKPEGFNTDIGDSAAGKLYNECLYTSNVMSRFRYVMDKDEVNHLVVFRSYVDEDTNEDGIRKYCQFDGIDDSLEKSGLPVPAPLYYLGEPYNYSDIPDAVKADLVSCDTRTYSASDSTNPGPGYDEASWDNPDKYGWAETLGNTYTEDVGVTKLTNNWQFQSVSNYNRFHAPANSAGYAVGYDPACRNIAKATKLFPIGHYDVLSTKSDTKVAKVQYSVDINMKSVFTEVANRTTRYFDESGEQVPSSNYKMSFKFNRVGIYAVPVALHAYTEPGENQDNCTNYELQMQITGNSEPVLFAVMDLDAPVIMSEDGCLDYKLKFNVDYSAENSDAVDSTSIFYNLYEDDAITWYKNQLIANASAANAITSLGVQMGYLRKQINSVMPGSTTGCTINDKGSTYVYTGSGLKNIKDVGNLGVSSSKWNEALVLGDTNGMGTNSRRSLAIGANSTDVKTSFVGSLVHASCDASRTFRASDSDSAKVVETLSNSIWWSETGSVLNFQDNSHNVEKVRDVFVFLGEHGCGFANPDWLGIGKDMETVGDELGTSTIQPYNTPMVFTGGIALGGHGVIPLGGNGTPSNSNYGLIKLGTAIKHVSKASELYDSDIAEAIVSVATTADEDDPINPITNRWGHNVVHSPHAGKVLTVLPEQELDGTLHIGLAKPQSGSGSSDITIIQEDGVIYPGYGYKPRSDSIRNVYFMSNYADSEYIDEGPIYKRHTIFQDGQFHVYDSAYDMPLFKSGYQQGYGFRPGATNHIVWNTWYSITLNGRFADLEYGGFTYYDHLVDSGYVIKTITNSQIASDVNEGDRLKVWDTMYDSYLFKIISITNDVITCEYDGGDVSELMIFNEPGIYSFKKYQITPAGSSPLSAETCDFDIVSTENTDSHIYELCNPARTMHFYTNSMVDGLVYELRINIRSIASSTASDDGLVTGDYGGMNAPSLTNRAYTIYFHNDDDTTDKAYMWGDDEHTVQDYVKPTFNRVPSDGTSVAFGPGRKKSCTAPVLATAVIHMVRVNGKLYIMSY